MATDRAAVLSVPAAAALLLWPALWNGYPIVFADTGTYLSQAIHRYAGWDRPVFYSLFMLPLHATVTTWPVVVVQALLAAWVLRLACRALVPGWSEATFLAVVAALSLSTWLPWIVCMLMPDVFTPLLVLVLCLLGVVPARMARWERIVLAALATFMIASQLSSLPLACALAGVLLAVGHMAPSGTSIVGYGARSSLHRHGRACPDHLRFNGGGWMAGTRPAMTISAGVTSPAQSAPTAAAAMTRPPPPLAPHRRHSRPQDRLGYP